MRRSVENSLKLDLVVEQYKLQNYSKINYSDLKFTGTFCTKIRNLELYFIIILTRTYQIVLNI